MRRVTIICITSIAVLHCSYSRGQDAAKSDQPAAAPDDKAKTAELRKQIKALLDESDRLIKARRPGKHFMIGWKTKDGTVTQILLIPDKELPTRSTKDFSGLKGAIAKLPKGSQVSYTFSDFRPDLLTHKQIIELRDLCKKSGMVFSLHKGG